jgi:hypothetical protein
MTSMILSLLVAAVTPAQVSAVKEHYLTLGSTAIEAKPVTTLPAETKVERVDASHQMRSASFGHKTTLVIELPQSGAPTRYWVEYGKSTNHPAALYGPFTVPSAQ